MKKITKTLIFVLLFIVSFLFIGCGKKENIEPHIEVVSETCEIENGLLELEYGDIIYLDAKFYSNDYKEGTNNGVEISSPFGKEVIVLDGFKVICVGVGSDEVTFTYNEGEVSASYKLKINVNEKEIGLERLVINSKNVVSVDDYFEITLDTFGATVKEDIIFVSSDESIATVDSDGYVSGISEGKCEITAYLKNNPEIKNTVVINVISTGEVTTTAEARFTVQEATNYLELPYGLIFQKLTALTSTPLEGADADGYSGITAPLIPNQYYPQQISLLEIPNTGDVKVTSWANWGSHKWTLTSVRGLILNFEKNNPGWKVIAAINGDFFDINANGNLPYQTNSVVISNGNFYKTTGNGSVAFPNDGTGVIGNKPIVRSNNMYLDVLDKDGNVLKTFEVENLNKEPGDGESTIYFASYNSEKQIVPFDIDNNDGVFFVKEAELALPNNDKDFYGRGVIVSDSSAKLNINKGNFAIYTKNQEIKNYLKEGMRIRIQYVLVGDYTGIGDITGCGGTLMLDGEYNPGGAINDRAPRTVIGSTADGRIIMMVIDGRQGSKNMFGADAKELAAIMKAYGCVEAFNLDGGGSSTLVIRQNGQFIVTNSPSDGRERSDSNCVLIVVRDIDFDVSITDVTKTSAKINVKVNDTFEKDVKKVFARVNGEYHEIIDGACVIEGLVHNNTYNYTLCYENSNGEIVETLTGGEIKTVKDLYTYLATYVYEDEETFTIEVRYLDIDKSSTIAGAKIALTSIKDGEVVNNNTFLNGSGTITLKKSIIGDEITKMDISFSYQVDYEKREPVDMEDVKFIYIDRR